MNPIGPMRSKLFVPASRPELFAKALASAADSISIDLEDAVAESRKAEARDATRAFLRSAEAAASNKIIIVRVNALGTPHFEQDVSAVAQARLDILNLPKPECADHIRTAAAYLERQEAEHGIAEPAAILANIETPRALRCAVEIASAHPRVAGLQIGYGDLFEAMGVDRYDAATVHQILLTMRLAAAEAGVWAYDGAFAAIANPDGYRDEAARARRLGYIGKSCIHPSQISLANDVFRPTEEQIAHARRVVDAAAKAGIDGVGAFTVDGRMVDAPFIRRAEAILHAAAADERNGVR
jgi:citrate lyase subunit beta/citryl-CoA lyase